MSLPKAQSREEIHARDLVMRGYRRSDGLFEVEGRLTDRKTHPIRLTGGRNVPAAALIHDMTIRLTFGSDCTVREAIACSDVTPHPICPTAAAALACLAGLTVGPGWGREVRARVGGTSGCTHLVEMLVNLGTVAHQTIAPFRAQVAEGPDVIDKPEQIDTCLAYSSTGPMVAAIWPRHAKRSD